MLGADFQHKINQILSEFNSTWIDLKTSFDYVFEAALDFGKETGSCHGSQTITTLASQPGYSLNPDFLEILTKDDHNDGLLKYYDGSCTEWLTWESYSDFLQNENAAGTPNSFAVLDDAIPTRLTGAATSIGLQVGGESVLTDVTGAFASLYPGDTVINTTKSYYGYVIAKPTSATAVTTAMFDLSSRGGSYAGWAVNDDYIIQPAPRYKIFLDPPPSSAGNIVTVSYIAKPSPVYSDYGTYSFATGYEDALIKYAAWLYKHRDSKPQFGDPLYIAYERAMRKGKSVNRKAVGAVGFRVNWVKG